MTLTQAEIEWRKKMLALGVSAHKLDAVLGVAKHGGGARVQVGPGIEPEPEDTPLPVPRHLCDGAMSALGEMERFEQGNFADRIQTGITKLDRHLRGGLRGGTLTLLGAPSGAGKTTLAQQIASEAAHKGPVLFVSPEMSLAELAEREIVKRSGRSLWQRRPWNNTDSLREFARCAHENAADEMIEQGLPLFVIDQDCTMAEIEIVAHAMTGIRLVVIDYAQQVASTDYRQPRYLAVGEIGTRAIILARALNIPVLVASQVNVATNEAKQKVYSFRETAILEHKAHTILILEVVWEEVEESGMLQRRPSSTTIVCTKQRSGMAFRLPVAFDPKYYRITNLVDPHAEGFGSESVLHPPEIA